MAKIHAIKKLLILSVIFLLKTSIFRTNVLEAIKQIETSKTAKIAFVLYSYTAIRPHKVTFNRYLAFVTGLKLVA